MLEALNQSERDLVQRSLLAACEGSFFPEWEFPTLFGVTRSEVRQTLETFPGSEDGETGRAAINNAMLNLVSYPHNADFELTKYGLDKTEITRVHMKWLKALGI